MIFNLPFKLKSKKKFTLKTDNQTVILHSKNLTISLPMDQSKKNAILLSENQQNETNSNQKELPIFEYHRHLIRTPRFYLKKQ